MKSNEKNIKKIEKYSTMIKEKAENISLLSTFAGVSLAASTGFIAQTLYAFRYNSSIYNKIIFATLALITGGFGIVLYKSKNNELKSLKKNTDYLETKAKSQHTVKLVLKNNQNDNQN